MIPYSKFIVRIPQLPLSTTLVDGWEPLLESIRYASPNFYQQIKDVKYQDLENQPKAVQETIHKYFNRAKYRCTPLGTFASVGVMNAGITNDERITIDQERIVHQFIDWPQINTITPDTTVEKLKLFANSTYYQIADEIRYVKRIGEKFEMASISTLPMVVEILKYLKEPKPYVDLIEDIPGSEPYIQPLVECGLIITENEPNMIGEDYFTRIAPEYLDNSKKYVISEVTSSGSTIPKHYFKNISALIKLLSVHTQTGQSKTDLTDFTARYTQKFDRQDIPLMIAIDPDIGVGYGDFHTAGISSIIRNLQVDKKEESDRLAQHLNNHLNEGYNQDTIRLDELLKETEEKQAGLQLPNSLSMICSLHDGQLYVKRIGGNSANQLAGRFTLASEKFEQLSREIAALEAESNPDIIFFDISYNAELTVDNVSRRRAIYDYELNLLNYPGTSQILTVDDIVLSVSGERVILRSKTLGRRLVPRMASAYNYRRSKLPVFRFLYDMSFHNIIADLSFDPTDIVKGRKFYPTVQFRNIVLSQRKIKLTKHDLQTIDPVETIIKTLKDANIYPVVRIHKGEEDTVFNLDSDIQINLLVQEIRKSGEAWIEQLPLPQINAFEDSRGQGYNNEMVIPLVHRNEVYKASSPVDGNYMEQRSFLPLDQWLYFEVYSSPAYGDSILLQISELINEYATRINKWFFIRYNENGPHIRFRILFNEDFQLQFFRAVTDRLRPMYSSNIIHDITIKIYNREMERYGVANIEMVENHFHMDSKIVVEMIKEVSSDLQKYTHCVRIFQLVASFGSIGPQRYAKWTSHIKEMFEREHHLQIEQFREVNRYIQQQRSEMLEPSNSYTKQEQLLAISIHNLLQACPNRRRAPMLTDLMHMHINRLFPDYQRTHELLILTMLTSFIRTAQKISKASTVGL